MSVFRCGVDLRTHQKAIVKAFDNGRRDIIVLGSRRLGKTILAWSVLIREAMTKRGVYWYCFDEYATAKRNVWYGMTHEGIRLIDMISPAMVAQTNKEELRIELTNGSIIQLIGINKANSLVGNGIMGIVFDEYALLDYESVAYIQQSLASTNGWRILISTPRGKNHFYDIWTMAGKMPDVWARFNYHCGMPEITKYLPPGFLEKQKAEMIAKYGNDALFQQEYMTSWTTPNSGSVFGDLMNILRADGRVAPCIPSRGEHIYTAWDLGNCLSGDVDVLTPTGWVNVKDMPREIAVWRNGVITFESVDPFSGYIEEAIHIKGAHIDIKVSPNHKMMIYDGHREREVLAADIKPRSHRIVKNGKMATTPVNNWDLLNIMVQADGCLVHENTNYFRVSVKKDRKKQRCEELLQLCGVKYHKRDYANGFTKYGFNLPKTRDWKSLDDIMSNNQENIDELVKWDGHFSRGNTYIYNSVVERCVDKVAAMAVAMGYTPFISKHSKRSNSKGNKTIYRVSFSIRPKAKYTSIKSVERVEFNDYVYCFKTHAGWFVARDKHKHVFISGNADHTSIVLFYVDDNGYPYVFDHIENRNVDVMFYVNRLKDLGYLDRIATHFLPHDAGYRKGAWNETYAQVLAGQGIKNVVVLKKPGTVSDKLNYLRRVFAGMRIDNSCTRIMECLDKLEYEWRPKVGIWSDKPTHKNGYSDTVDSLSYMGQAILTYGLKRDEPLITAPVLENMQDDNSLLNSIAESIFVVNTDSNSSIGGIVH